VNVLSLLIFNKGKEKTSGPKIDLKILHIFLQKKTFKKLKGLVSNKKYIFNLFTHKSYSGSQNSLKAENNHFRNFLLKYVIEFAI
jgi:hypothetical protein